jgi:hypothetical protein
MEMETSMGTGSAPAPTGASPMPMEDAPAGDMPEMGGGGDSVDLVLSIDVDDLEALLNGATEEFAAEPVAGDMPGAGEGGDDMGIDLVDEPSEGGAPEDKNPMLMDKKPEDKKEDMPEGKKPTGKPLTEAAVIARAAQTVKTLQTQLSESKLLTAKALYVSKFTIREDLSLKQKQTIASYFDKAKNLAEAKETYNKIKKILAESTTSNKLSGSASKPTSTGSAKLNESTSQAQPGDIDQARWMLLAGIKNRK